MLTVGVVIVFGFFRSNRRDTNSEETLSAELISSETVDIVAGPDTAYGLIYSSDSFQGDQIIAKELKKLLTVSSNKFNPYPDMAAETEFEILIGNTNRAYSAELLEAVNSYGSADEFYIWGFGYKDGKLAFTANSPIGFELGKKEFFTLVSEEGTLSVPRDLLVINLMSHEAYEEMIRAEEEAKRQEKIDALIEKNNAFADEPRLNEGYMSMIGEENAYYQLSPYERPWVYPAKDQHPRYLITEKNVERIKEMMNDPEYAVIFANLEKLAAADINDGIFPERTGSSGETNRYSETTLSGISARAMMYLLTDDEIYAREAIIAIKNAMLTLKYTTDLHMDVYHGASHVMVVLASVYDWCYDILSEEDKWQMITGAVTCLWSTMEFNYPPTNNNGVSGHGTGPQLLRDYMSLAVAFYDEAPDWWEFIAGRYFEEYLPVANEQYASGWVSQGTVTYAPIKVMVMEWAAYVIKVCTGENFFTEDAALSMQFLQSHIMPNGNYFQTGDGGRSPYGTELGYAEYFVNAALYNDAFSLAWAKYTSDNYEKYNTGSIYTMTPDLQLCFISTVTAPQVEKTETIELVQYFKDPAGQMIARNSWESDAAAVFMKIGNMTNANHDIYDHGTFQIYYKGLLAGTSGSYKQYGGNSHYYYLQSTVAHNGLLIFNPVFSGDAYTEGGVVINGSTYYYSGGQHRLPGASSLQEWQNESYRMAETTGADWGYNRDGSTKYAYIAGDITQAYDDVTVDYVGRRMFTLYTANSEIPMVFLTFDEITSKKESFEKTYLLHTINEPEIDEENLSATIVNGEGKLVMQSLFGADRIEKVGGEGKAYWINDYYKEDGTYVPGKNCLDEYTPNDNYNNIWGRVQLRTAGDKTSELLTAMYVTDSGSTAALEIGKYRNEYVYGASFDREIVMFYAGADKAYKSFAFETEGTGLYNYYISGISDGIWNVKVDGIPVACALSSDESGMITFTAPAGTVELIPDKNVVGANGGKIQYVSGGAVLPDDTYYAYNRETATPLPETAVRGEDIFLGWYTSPSYEPETRVYEVPIGTEGTFKVYAKWLAAFVSEDYLSTKVNHKENNRTLNGITYAGSGKAGSSFMTLSDESGKKYLEWLEGSSDSFISSTNISNNIAHAVSEDKTISFHVRFSGNPNSSLMASSFSIIAKTDVNGRDISSKITTIFKTNTEGDVFLGDTEIAIAKLSTAEVTTLRIVLNFKTGRIEAYDDSGSIISSILYVPDAELKAETAEDAMKCYNQYLFYWHGDTSSAITDAGMRIYGIKVQDSNIFEDGSNLLNNTVNYKENGGILPENAPTVYDPAAETALPIPAKDGYSFKGWYTTANFAESTKIEKIAAGTSGTVTLFAKWTKTDANGFDIVLEEDYTGESIDISGSSDAAAQGSSVSHKPNNSGAAMKTVTGADGNTFLRIDKPASSKNSIIYRNDGKGFAAFAENQVSFEISFSKVKDVAVTELTFETIDSGGKLFTVNNSGEVYLNGGTVNLGTLTEDGFTKIRIALDFDSGKVSAYGGDGEILDTVTISINKSNIKRYILYINVKQNTSLDTAVLIDDIKIADGNIFEN